MERERDNKKPPYRVPLKTDAGGPGPVKVASTFAGCGGSSYGYKLAGCEVLWANELDAHAAECYRLNGGRTIVDERDIREVRPEKVLEACGLAEGELDVLDGSPPCQTFSTAGNRQMADARTDLFAEYVRLLRGIRPRALVAENVSGMAKGVAKGVFKEVLRAMRAAGYRVACRMLDAQWLGVPQQRQRVIFVGFREDLGIDPTHPSPLPYRYSVRDACPWIGSRVAGVEDLGKIEKVTFRQGGRWKREITDRPSFCVGSTQNGIDVDGVERRKFTIEELMRICSFPDDFELTGSYAKRWARLGNSVPPVMMFHVARLVADALGGEGHGLGFDPVRGWEPRKEWR